MGHTFLVLLLLFGMSYPVYILKYFLYILVICPDIVLYMLHAV